VDTQSGRAPLRDIARHFADGWPFTVPHLRGPPNKWHGSMPARPPQCSTETGRRIIRGWMPTQCGATRGGKIEILKQMVRKRAIAGHHDTLHGCERPPGDAPTISCDDSYRGHRTVAFRVAQNTTADEAARHQVHEKAPVQPQRRIARHCPDVEVQKLVDPIRSDMDRQRLACRR
jgi:hypothetical protein